MSKLKIPIECSRLCSTSLLAPLLIALLSPLPNTLPSLQPTFTRRTSGHCLGTNVAENLSLFHPLNVVSVIALPPPRTFSSLSFIHSCSLPCCPQRFQTLFRLTSCFKGLMPHLSVRSSYIFKRSLSPYNLLHSFMPNTLKFTSTGDLSHRFLYTLGSCKWRFKAYKLMQWSSAVISLPSRKRQGLFRLFVGQCNCERQSRNISLPLHFFSIFNWHSVQNE
jgi:hypothetical protein